MKNLESKLPAKTKDFKGHINLIITMSVQPFKELPPVQCSENVKDARMNAHDLFSHYTALVIGEDVIYSR